MRQACQQGPCMHQGNEQEKLHAHGAPTCCRTSHSQASSLQHSEVTPHSVCQPAMHSTVPVKSRDVQSATQPRARTEDQTHLRDTEPTSFFFNPKPMCWRSCKVSRRDPTFGFWTTHTTAVVVIGRSVREDVNLTSEAMASWRAIM